MNFPTVYAVKHKDETVRANSRSGGIFTALSDYVLNQNGIVYGCVLDNNFNACHVRATTEIERDLMRGSKYIQSMIGETFLQAKQDLEQGKLVLFSGTSCQIAGLKKFLNKKYETLICVDIVCHGVPSNKVWLDYIKYQEDNHSSKCTAVNFRNKTKFGWKAHVETLTFEDGTTIDSRIFKTLFYGHKILRPSCYKCPYKDILHPADISIADYWGIDLACPGFNDNKGVSLVLINNTCGETLFQKITSNLHYELCKIEDSMQDPLIKPYPAPSDRSKFWKDYQNKPFSYIVKKYGQINFKQKVKRKLDKFKSLFTK